MAAIKTKVHMLPWLNSKRLLIVLAIVAMGFGTTLFTQIASPLYNNPATELIVHNPDGSVVALQTVIVSSPQDMQRGLMHIKHMHPNLTMLFLHANPRPASMWMKNTHISLDMWFVGTDLRIKHIAHETTPLSLTSISHDLQVRAVVEINGGLSVLLGIQEGSQIEFDPDP